MRLIKNGAQSDHADRATELGCLPGGAYRCRDDAAWTIEYLGRATSQLLGFPYPAEGRSLLRRVAPEDRDRAQEALTRARTAGGSYRFCFQLDEAGPHARRILDTGFWLPQPHGPVIRTGFLADTTSCTATAGGASETERLLLRTFGRWQDAALVVDPVHRGVVACNQAVEAVFGFAPEELIGANTALIHLDPRHQAEFARRVRPELETTGRARLEFPLRRKDGTRIEADIALTAFEDPAWGPAWLGVVRDITANKRDQEAVRELAAHLQRAREQERECIARELHDQLGSALMLLALDCEQIEDSLDRASEDTHRHLETMRSRVREASDTMRRVTSYLRPPLLDRLGLQAAVENHVAQVVQRSPLDCKLRVHGAEDAPREPDIEIAIFRMVQEALTNVLRHAQAKRTEIDLRYEDQAWILEVTDDGAGFDPQQVDATKSFGLRGMEERARHLRGTLELESRPENGTRLRARVPVTDDETG